MQNIYKFSLKLFAGFFFVGINFVHSQPNNNVQNDKLSNMPSKSKTFEGKIDFVQEYLEDTFLYTYYVKNRIVRLDAQDKCNSCKNKNQYTIFDLNKGTITAVDPVRKMYMNLPVTPYSNADDDNFQIIKTNNSKKIQGYKCYQWRVKNKAQKTEISYWVAKDNFAFFEDFLKLFNRSEKHAVYYLRIPETNGYFPMLSEERSTLREPKMTLKVTQISKQQLDADIFSVPKEFRSYEH